MDICAEIRSWADLEEAYLPDVGGGPARNCRMRADTHERKKGASG